MTSPMPPGCYPNPSSEPGQRYWGGHGWTIVSVPEAPPAVAGWYANPSGEPGNDTGMATAEPSLTLQSRAAQCGPIVPVRRHGDCGRLVAVPLALVGGCTACTAAVFDNGSRASSGSSQTPTMTAQPTKSREEKLQDELDYEA